MSAYNGKPLPQQHGFDSTRQFPDPTYTFTAPPYVSQPSGTANPAAYYNAPQMVSIGYGPRATAQFDDAEGAYLNVGSTSIPDVLSYQPASGGEGIRFEVSISTVYEMAPTAPVSIMFSSRKCIATVTKTQQQGAVCQYLVTTDVPPFQATGWSTSTLPVFLLVENGDGDLLSKVEVGSFTYDEGNSQATESHQLSHGRKTSREAPAIKGSPSMRLPVDGGPKVDLPQYGYTGSESVAQASFLQPGSSYSMMQQYPRQPQYQSQNPQRSYQHPNSSTSSSPSIKTSPQVPAWSPYPSASVRGSAASRVARSPAQKPSTMSRPSLTATPAPMLSNPPLIRTSTLQQTPSPANTPASGHAGNAYQYSPYAPKASLKIAGNLDSMALDWTYEEWDAKRRLVLFERTQNGSEITTTFKPVTADERPHHSICISCIFWPEKQEMFVTSVDTISLLEKLVNARFTVEEKNRIRRNLEGFRPLTVSKGKPDTEEMFKIIMLFPNPKPRNIEKDVKVFPWKILSSALKKIISKYSASPSSTLPPAPGPILLTPSSQTGYATDSNNRSKAGVVSDHNLASPLSMSGASASYNASARTLSPPVATMSNRQSQNIQGHGQPDLRLSVPTFSPHSHMSSQSQGQPQSHLNQTQHQNPAQSPWSGVHAQLSATSGYGSSSLPTNLGDQSTRGTLDWNSYLQASPSTATPTSAMGPGINQLGQSSGGRLSSEHHASSRSGEDSQRSRTGQIQSQQMPSGPS